MFCPTTVHYVQARDDFEQKVARINKRLIHLIREGEAASRLIASIIPHEADR
jgi:hypothetical protein